MDVRGWRFRFRNRRWERLDAFFILPAVFRGQVNLRIALSGQRNVHFDKEAEPSENATLSKPGLGFHGAGDGDPYVALLLGQGTPTRGDRAKMSAASHLRRGARVVRDKGKIADLAVAIALPDHIPAFP